MTRAMQETNAALAEKLAAIAAKGPLPASPVSNWVPVRFRLSLDQPQHSPAVNGR